MVKLWDNTIGATKDVLDFTIKSPHLISADPENLARREKPIWLVWVAQKKLAKLVGTCVQDKLTTTSFSHSTRLGKIC
jgi:hypothetical protein